MAVFVQFYGWLKFSKSCAFGAGAFGAGLAALAGVRWAYKNNWRLLGMTGKRTSKTDQNRPKQIETDETDLVQKSAVGTTKLTVKLTSPPIAQGLVPS